MQGGAEIALAGDIKRNANSRRNVETAGNSATRTSFSALSY